jgi:hypothetical protein
MNYHEDDLEPVGSLFVASELLQAKILGPRVVIPCLRMTGADDQSTGRHNAVSS